MNPLFFFLSGVIVTFGLWQLDWAFWVDKIDAFKEYWHIGKLKDNLSLVYLIMMISPDTSLLGAYLLRNVFIIIPGWLLFSMSLLYLVQRKQTAPLTYRISWWGPITISIEQWIGLNMSIVLAGLAVGVIGVW